MHYLVKPTAPDVVCDNCQRDCFCDRLHVGWRKPESSTKNQK